MNKLLFLLFLSGQLCFAQVQTQQVDLSHCALELTKQEVSYDPSYFSIDYPNGDIPNHKGVCYRWRASCRRWFVFL